MNIFSMCFFKHSYGKFGKPFKVFGANWKQARVCEVCGLVDVKNLGHINTDRIIYDTL